MRHALAGRLALPLAAILLSGCWYHRIEVGSPVTGATDYESATYWSLAWGVWQREPQPTNCNGQALKEVKVSSNLGFALITVVTLGLVAPERISWKCAKATPAEGGIPGSAL
jgi:hypothetical protein